MKVSLYLTDYEKELIKNEMFYKLRFFDSINGVIFTTYIHELSLVKDYIKIIDNGNSKTIENLKSDLKKCYNSI